MALMIVTTACGGGIKQVTYVGWTLDYDYSMYVQIVVPLMTMTDRLECGCWNPTNQPAPGNKVVP